MNRNSGRYLATPLLALLLSVPAVAQDDTKQLAAQARRVLRQYCQRCHHGPGSEGSEYDFLKHADLIAKVGDEKPLVVAGKPDESYLLERVVKNQMPPKNIRERPSDADVAILRKWIAAGAPAFVDDKSAPRKFITLQETLTAVRNHLRDAPREKRAYLRYFTLTHLHNNPNVPDDDLRLGRAALSKAINSLSWKPRIVRPVAIDKPEAILVVDVSELDWDKNDLWRAVMEAYPYGLKYRNHPNEELRKLDEDIADLTGCDMPLVRADWFVATATRPPLYHTLLQIPKHAGELERRLGVNIRDNFLYDRLARAGFARSGVSGQNRLVERHAIANGTGAYWKSYDFKPDSGRAKLLRFPLGPLNLFPEAKHPFAGQAFVHDGGEIIFNLPNGLQGYMLVNGKDDRIDEGPVQVVSDALKTSGTPAIFTGVSCMACHKHGMIALKDTIRDTSAVFGEAEKKVRKLYPEEKRMTEWVQEDEKRFLDALELSIGKFLRVGPDAKKPLKEFPEPVGEIARSYRLSFLDAKAVACELDLDDPKGLLVKVGETNLKKLGLEPLLKDGVISRLEWEAVDGSSLMQEVARVLRYTPFEVTKRRE